MNLYENEFVLIRIDESVPCLSWIAKKSIPSDNFRESETKSLEFYVEYKSRFPGMQWFVDARKVQSVLPEDTQWVADEILPKLAAAGLKKEAFVVPESSLGRMAVKSYTSQGGQTIEIQVYSDEAMAKAWLKP